jgi:group I intron endonuclease
MESGIYKITNIQTNHVYIGQSVVVKRRLRRHTQQLRDGIHENSYLLRHYNKYGKDNFTFEIIEYCSLDEMDMRECYWIDYYDSMNRAKGYNLESGGNPQKVLSEETKEKKRGKNNPMYGKKWNENQRNGIPIANRGNSNLLVEKDVENIKIRIASGATRTEIAKEYGLHISTVSKITRGKNWTWVKPELNNILFNQKIKSYNRACAGGQ